MAVFVGFSSYLLLSVLCFNCYISCSEITTETESDGPASASTSSTGNVESTTSDSGQTARTVPACSIGDWCGILVYDRISRMPNYPLTMYCTCPEGFGCTQYDGEDMIGAYFAFKCRKIVGSTEAPLNVERMNRAEEMAGSANSYDVASDVAIDIATETNTPTKISSTTLEAQRNDGLTPASSSSTGNVESTTTDSRPLGRTPRTLSECSFGDWCGLLVYDRISRKPNYPLIMYCTCPEGFGCTQYDGEDMIGTYFAFKCQKVVGSTVAPLNVERMQRAEEMAGSTNSYDVASDGEVGVTTETDTPTEMSSTMLHDRVGHFDHSEL